MKEVVCRYTATPVHERDYTRPLPPTYRRFPLNLFKINKQTNKQRKQKSLKIPKNESQIQGGSSKRPFSVAALVPRLCLLLALLPLFRQPGLLGAPTRWFYDDGDDDDDDDDEDHVDDFLLRSASTCIHPVKPYKVVQQVTIIIVIILIIMMMMIIILIMVIFTIIIVISITIIVIMTIIKSLSSAF